MQLKETDFLPSLSEYPEDSPVILLLWERSPKELILSPICLIHPLDRYAWVD